MKYVSPQHWNRYTYALNNPLRICLVELKIRPPLIRAGLKNVINESEDNQAMKLSLAGLILGLLFSFASQVTATNDMQEKQAVRQKSSDLEVSLAADKYSYKPGDRIKLQVTLTNSNAVKDLFVYGTLQFGPRASFTLFRRNAKGIEVPTRFIDDAWELPPKANDRSAFVKLLPFHFPGTTYSSSIHLLNLERAGKYTMWVEYHCPISVDNVEVAPFWGKESGTIKSNVIEIEVQP